MERIYREISYSPRYSLLPVSEVSTVQKAARECRVECTMECTTWPRVGGVALPLLRFFAYKIRAHEKVRKGEGEPGGEKLALFCPG